MYPIAVSHRAVGNVFNAPLALRPIDVALNALGIVIGITLLFIAFRIVLEYLRSKASEWDKKQKQAFDQATDIENAPKIQSETLYHQARREPFKSRYEKVEAWWKTMQAELSKVLEEREEPHYAQDILPHAFGALLLFLPMLSEINDRLRSRAKMKEVVSRVAEAKRLSYEIERLLMEIRGLGEQETRVARVLREKVKQLHEALKAEVRPQLTFIAEQGRIETATKLLDQIDQWLTGPTPPEEHIEEAYAARQEVEVILESIQSKWEQVQAAREQVESGLRTTEQHIEQLSKGISEEEAQGRPVSRLRTETIESKKQLVTCHQSFNAGEYRKALQAAESILARVDGLEAELARLREQRGLIAQAIQEFTREWKDVGDWLQQLPGIYNIDVTRPKLLHGERLVAELRSLLVSENVNDLAMQFTRLHNELVQTRKTIAAARDQFNRLKQKYELQSEMLNDEVMEETLQAAAQYHNDLSTCNSVYWLGVSPKSLMEARAALQLKWGDLVERRKNVRESEFQRLLDDLDKIQNQREIVQNLCREAKEAIQRSKTARRKAEQATDPLAGLLDLCNQAANDSGNGVKDKFANFEKQYTDLIEKFKVPAANYDEIATEARVLQAAMETVVAKYRQGKATAESELRSLALELSELRNALATLQIDAVLDFRAVVDQPIRKIDRWRGQFTESESLSLLITKDYVREGTSIRDEGRPALLQAEGHKRNFNKYLEEVRGNLQGAKQKLASAEGEIGQAEQWNGRNWIENPIPGLRNSIEATKKLLVAMSGPDQKLIPDEANSQLEAINKAIARATDKVYEIAKEWARKVAELKDMSHRLSSAMLAGNAIANRLLQLEWRKVRKQIQQKEEYFPKCVSYEDAHQTLEAALKLANDFFDDARREARKVGDSEIQVIIENMYVQNYHERKDDAHGP